MVTFLKSFFVVSAWVLFLNGPVPSYSDEPRVLTHTFPSETNKSRLLVFVDEDGRGNVVFEPSGHGPKRTLLNNVRFRYLFSRSAIGLGVDGAYEAPADAKIVVLATDEGVYVFDHQGGFEQLPFSEPLADLGGGALRISNRVFETERREYMALAIQIAGREILSENAVSNGETFLIRDDGRWLRVAFDYHDLQASAVTTQHLRDGILLLRPDFRPIDLRAFEAEQKFTPLPPMVVTSEATQDGKSKQIDPVTSTDEMFGDMLKDLQHESHVFDIADEAAIEAIRTVLLRKQSGNPVLLGRTGTGRQSLIKTFLKRVRQGKYPEIPRTLRVYDLTSGSLEEDTKWAGTFAKKIKILSAAAREVPILLFMGNLHAQRGKGTHSNDSNDYFQRLIPLLSSGRIRVISYDTPEEYLHAIKGDANLGRLFTEVQLREPDMGGTIARVHGWLEHYEMPVPSAGDLELAYRMSEQFLSVGSQPAKLIALLEDTYAKLAIQKRLDIAPVRADFEAVLQSIYGASPALFDRARAKRNLDRFDEVMDARLIASHEIKRVARELVGQWYARVNDPKLPAVSILYTGAKGTGKTEFGRALAEALELPIEIIEMNQFDGKDPQSTAKKLLKQIAQALQRHSFCVIVFDEFEKAARSAQLALLSVLESGTFSVDLNMGTGGEQNTRPELVNAKNAVLVLTSNAGQAALMQEGEGRRVAPFSKLDAMESAVPRANSKEFEEVLVADGIPDTTFDRVQAVVPAYPPTKEAFKAVLRMHAQRAVQEQLFRWKVDRIDLVDLDDWLNQKVESLYHSAVSNRAAIRAVIMDVRRALGMVDPDRVPRTVKIRLLSCEQAMEKSGNSDIVGS